MKPSLSMRKMILALAEKHGLDLTKPGKYIRLAQKNFDDLVIEVLGGNRIAITHYYKVNDDQVIDLEIIYKVVGDNFYGAEMQNALGTRVYERDKKFIYPQAARDIYEMSIIWARNLREQGWLKNGKIKV